MISNRNSTSSNIDDGSSWTGGIDEVAEYAGVSLSIYSDVDLTVYVEQALTTSGTFEFSEEINYEADTEASATYNLRYRFFRLRIENDSGSASTELRVCSKFHKGLPIETPLEITGDLSVSEYVGELELAAGNIQGRGSKNIFGIGKVHTGGLGVVSSLDTPAIAWVPLTTGVSLEIISDNSQDNPTGTGAREVRIQGINSAGQSTEQLVIMNGTTAVSVTGTWLRVNFFEVSVAGSSLANEGIIDLRVAGGGTVHARIQADKGRGSQVVYRAPTGTKIYLRDFSYSAGDYAVIYSIEIWMFDPNANVKRLLFETETSDSPNPQNFDLGRIELPAGAEFALQMQSDIGGAVPVYASINIEEAA